MELNREQIIKALECCSVNEDCAHCPCWENCKCINSLLRDALALIRELTEENERLRIRAEEGTLATTYSAMPNIDQKAQIKELL